MREGPVEGGGNLRPVVHGRGTKVNMHHHVDVTSKATASAPFDKAVMKSLLAIDSKPVTAAPMRAFL